MKVKILLIMLAVMVAILVFSCSSVSNPSSGNGTSGSTTASTLTLSEKGQQIEGKILRGEALNSSDLEGFSTTELRILRNVHFARYGRKFDRPGLGDYFYTRSWYKPNDSFNDGMLSLTDKENVRLILSREKPEIVQSAPIQSAIPEQIQNNFKEYSEIPTTPGEIWLAYVQSSDSGNFDYYLKQSKARSAILYPICPKAVTMPNTNRVAEDSEILKSFNHMTDPAKRLERGEPDVKSRRVISENINGDEAEIVVSTEYVNGQTDGGPIKYRKFKGFWELEIIVKGCEEMSNE